MQLMDKFVESTNIMEGYEIDYRELKYSVMRMTQFWLAVTKTIPKERSIISQNRELQHAWKKT